MAITYTALNKATVGSGGSSAMEFTSIPQTYTDLVIKVSARTDQTNVTRSFKIQPNTTDFSTGIRLGTEGSPQADYSDGTITIYCPGSSATASTFGASETYVTNYASTTTNKLFNVDTGSGNNGTAGGISLQTSLYNSNNAITSIKIVPSLGNFVQYTTATLYGVKKD